jgi:Rieske Fe-S protein
MDRKEFIKGSCGICLALSSGFLMSALMSSCKTALGVIKTSSSNNLVNIPLTEFATANFKMVRVSNYDYDLAVQKLEDGNFRVLVMECTHAGQPLTKTGNTYYCTMHGTQYANDGKVIKGPAERDMKRLHATTDNNSLIIHLT